MISVNFYLNIMSSQLKYDDDTDASVLFVFQDSALT